VWLTERRFAEAAILDVHGTLTGPIASELLQMTARTQVAAGARLLIVNLGDVTAFDDEGVRTLHAIAGSTRQRGIETKVAGDLAQLARAKVLSAGTAAFRAYPTVDEALTDIRTALEHRHSRARTGLGERLAAVWRRLFARN